MSPQVDPEKDYWFSGPRASGDEPYCYGFVLLDVRWSPRERG